VREERRFAACWRGFGSNLKGEVFAWLDPTFVAFLAPTDETDYSIAISKRSSLLRYFFCSNASSVFEYFRSRDAAERALRLERLVRWL
jgi:hypothetical protein